MIFKRSARFETNTTTAAIDLAPVRQAGSSHDNETQSVRQAMAVIEFQPDGTVITANNIFLSVTGCSLSDIVGKHHRQFMFPEDAATENYANFWRDLARGKFSNGEFRRRHKHGAEIWIQASYIPVMNELGEVVRVVKYALDITAAKKANLDNELKLSAIDRSQAVIEFDGDGIIQSANQNFLNTMGYRRDEVVGKHHRILVPEAERNSDQYRQFWAQLKAGKSSVGVYHRVSKTGRDVWLEASYNSFPQPDGTVRIVKFATDVTAQFQMKQKIATTGHAVASSVEQMVATIGEISENIQVTATLTSSTESTALTTRNTVDRLHDSSRTIEKVVELIQNLADQTNLLALNATIEAARAGDAGRGFAVVASEVKELARQTGNATKNIEASVREIQSCVLEAVASSTTINTEIAEVSGRMHSIASAVEEQSVTMHELSRIAGELRG